VPWLSTEVLSGDSKMGSCLGQREPGGRGTVWYPWFVYTEEEFGQS
jgi:hypothetical protein